MVEFGDKAISWTRKVLDKLGLSSPVVSEQVLVNALAKLNDFSRAGDKQAQPVARKVLIDGAWYNANYWIRLAIVRRALRLQGAIEVGLLGPYSRNRTRLAFRAFGISRFVDMHRRVRSYSYLQIAKEMLRGVEVPSDVLRLTLPSEFPAALFFDGVLKRQRRATIDVSDPRLQHYLAEAMAAIEFADQLISSESFDLVILSHHSDFTFGALAWSAVRRNITVLILYGDFGHQRFFRINHLSQFFLYPERPSCVELNTMPDDQVESLRQVGAKQLEARFTGKTADIGAIYAYQRRQEMIDRNYIARALAWDAGVPIIGVYNSNWFDYPHASGLRDFSDFLDWITETMEVAKRRSEVNWLFKSHPCDDWYSEINGQRLEDLVAELNVPHIKLADKSWNGLSLMRSVDGIVTCHGTIGIEATSQMIPVLVPYEGWYGHADFVLCAEGREDYLSILKTSWWEDMDMMTKRDRAQLFAGFTFCVPDWHVSCFYQDDSLQDKIFLNLDNFLFKNSLVLDREVQEVAAWFSSGHPYYHIYSMKAARSYRAGTHLA
jgi:hypothetical protein